MYVSREDVVFEGRWAYLVATPDAHGADSPKATDENSHLVAFFTEALRVTTPPPGVRWDGVAVNEETTGAARTVTFAGFAVPEPPGPLAFTEKVYVSTEPEVFFGIPTLWDALPDEQATVAGRPVRRGLTANAHFVACLTDTASVTLPPAATRDAGATLKDTTEGFGVEPPAMAAGTSASPATTAVATARGAGRVDLDMTVFRHCSSVRPPSDVHHFEPES